MVRILGFPGVESGASAVEYGLLLAGIALIVAGALYIFGVMVKGLFDSANTLLNGLI
jgi:Flp pilus assembly pilin Flp